MQLTPKIVALVAHFEGVALESYLDTGGVWTWSMGLTDAAGIKTADYIGRPAPLAECLQFAVDRMRSRYLPAVNLAFAEHDLSEAQIAAALSFHWNTGAIRHADWVKDFLAGKPTAARAALTGNYLQGGLLQSRRNAEAALFFDGHWPADMRCPLVVVDRATHKPHGARATDIMAALAALIGE